MKDTDFRWDGSTMGPLREASRQPDPEEGSRNMTLREWLMTPGLDVGQWTSSREALPTVVQCLYRDEWGFYPQLRIGGLAAGESGSRSIIWDFRTRANEHIQVALGHTLESPAMDVADDLDRLISTIRAVAATCGVADKEDE